MYFNSLKCLFFCVLTYHLVFCEDPSVLIKKEADTNYYKYSCGNTLYVAEEEDITIYFPNVINHIYCKSIVTKLSYNVTNIMPDSTNYLTIKVNELMDGPWNCDVLVSNANTNCLTKYEKCLFTIEIDYEMSFTATLKNINYLLVNSKENVLNYEENDVLEINCFLPGVKKFLKTGTLQYRGFKLNGRSTFQETNATILHLMDRIGKDNNGQTMDCVYASRSGREKFTRLMLKMITSTTTSISSTTSTMTSSSSTSSTTSTTTSISSATSTTSTTPTPFTSLKITVDDIAICNGNMEDNLCIYEGTPGDTVVVKCESIAGNALSSSCHNNNDRHICDKAKVNKYNDSIGYHINNMSALWNGTIISCAAQQLAAEMMLKVSNEDNDLQKNSFSTTPLVAGTVTGFVLALVLLFFICMYLRRRRMTPALRPPVDLPEAIYSEPNEVNRNLGTDYVYYYSYVKPNC